jgi:hypothetical protein
MEITYHEVSKLRTLKGVLKFGLPIRVGLT